MKLKTVFHWASFLLLFVLYFLNIWILMNGLILINFSSYTPGVEPASSYLPLLRSSHTNMFSSVLHGDSYDSPPVNHDKLYKRDMMDDMASGFSPLSGTDKYYRSNFTIGVLSTICGCLLIFAVVVGSCGMLLSNIVALYIFIAFVVIAGCLCVAKLILLAEMFKEWSPSELKRIAMISLLYDAHIRSPSGKIWQELQSRYQCCGALGHWEWQYSNYMSIYQDIIKDNEGISAIYDSSIRRCVPHSCCNVDKWAFNARSSHSNSHSSLQAREVFHSPETRFLKRIVPCQIQACSYWSPNTGQRPTRNKTFEQKTSFSIHDSPPEEVILYTRPCYPILEKSFMSSELYVASVNAVPGAWITFGICIISILVAVRSLQLTRNYIRKVRN